MGNQQSRAVESVVRIKRRREEQRRGAVAVKMGDVDEGVGVDTGELDVNNLESDPWDEADQM